jgi:uncharacterized protein YjhX (UPF0386 family)
VFKLFYSFKNFWFSMHNTEPQTAVKAEAAATSSAPRKRSAAAVAKTVTAKKASAPKAEKKQIKPEKAEKTDKKPSKPARVKLVRDGFTMPEEDFALFAKLKSRALAAKRETKKSELLRAGLRALAAMGNAELIAALKALPAIQVGRPKKAH